jgi:hypothetical protein
MTRLVNCFGEPLDNSIHPRIDAIGGHVKKGILASVFVTVFAVAGVSTADAQTSCSVSNSAGGALQCNGVFWGTSVGALEDGTALLKVQAKDLTGNGVNGGAQTVFVSVCDVGTANDKFGISIFRTASPKDIERCVTPTGSNGSCTENPLPKSATATSDNLFVVLDALSEDVAGSAGSPNARFRISSSGWESLKVSLVAAEDGIGIAFSGSGVCQ